MRTSVDARSRLSGHETISFGLEQLQGPQDGADKTLRPKAARRPTSCARFESFRLDCLSPNNGHAKPHQPLSPLLYETRSCQEGKGRYGAGPSSGSSAGPIKRNRMAMTEPTNFVVRACRVQRFERTFQRRSRQSDTSLHQRPT